MAPAQYPHSSGTRNLHDNLSDLRAQVAANQKVCICCSLFLKIVKHDSWPIQPDILNPPLLRLTSRKPLWLHLQPDDIKSRWRHNWKSAQVVNSHLVCDPTIRQPGFDFPRQQWLSCIMRQSDLAACGHVGVATRAGGVLFVTRRDTCVRACSGNSQSNVIN